MGLMVIPREEYERHMAAGRAIYTERVLPTLSPEQKGQYVRIHLESGEFSVGPTHRKARLDLWRKGLFGRWFTLRVGDHDADLIEWEPGYRIAHGILPDGHPFVGTLPIGHP